MGDRGYLHYDARGDHYAPTLEAVFKFVMMMRWQDFENFCAAIENHRGSTEGSRAKLRPDHVVAAYHRLFAARPAPVAPATKPVETENGETTK